MEDRDRKIASHRSTAGGSAELRPPAPGRVAAARDSDAQPADLRRFLQKAICQEFRAALGEALQIPLAIRLSEGPRGGGLEECSWADFAGSVEERTCCMALVAQPFQAVQAQAAPNGKPGPDGQPAPDEQPASDEQPATDVGTARGGEYAADLPPAWLEVSPQIAFPIIDRLLGGSGKEWYVPCRACTAIERRLLHRVGEAVAEGLSRAGPDGGAESLRWRCAAEAAELPDSSQTGPVVLAKFTLSMGRQAGALRLCLPRGLLARLLPAAATDGPPEAAARPAGTAPPHGQTAARQAGPLELSVVVQDIAISREELAQIEEGDILMTDTAEGGEVLVRIGGIPRFYARLGVSNGRKAIQITRRVDERR